jgi:hypothetical protein
MISGATISRSFSLMSRSGTRSPSSGFRPVSQDWITVGSSQSAPSRGRPFRLPVSEAGPYTIIVVAGREGTNRIAYATGNATIVSNQTKLIVTLDLRRAKPGRYVLLTELNGQDDWYSYPLRIQ